MNVANTFLFLLVSLSLYSQDNLNTVVTDFTVPINSKFTLKMIPSDEGITEFSVIKLEEYNKVVKQWGFSKLFKKKGKKDTIVFYFCFEESNDVNNPNSALLIKSYSDYSYKFKTEIQTEEGGKFTEIPNVGTHKNSIASDRWAKKTYKIRISNFEIKR